MDLLKTTAGWFKGFGVVVFSVFFVSNIFAEVETVYPEGPGPYGYWTSVVLDTTDSPHMVYRSGISGGSLKYVRKVNSNWFGEEIESSLDSEGGHASIGLTSSGDPRVSYHKTGAGLRFASRNNSSWTLRTLDPEGGMYTSIKVDTSDKIHISYFSGNKLKYAHWNGVVWSTSVVDQGGIVGRWTSLALDQSQNPAISYYDSTKGDLKFAQWDGTSWSTQTVISSGDVGKYSSLAIDSNNRPVISFIKVSGGLQMAKWNGAFWDIQTVYASGSEFTSLIIDGQGNPRIAFGEGSSLSLASFSGSVWSKTTVSSSYNQYPSLAWSRTQEPHLTYGSYYFIYSVLSSMSPPSNVIAASASSETIRWGWNDNSTGETGYRVINPGDLSPLSPELPANTTGWAQTGLTPNTSSQIIVQVFNSTSSRNSSPSQIVYTYAVPPTNTQVDSVNANAVGLSWSRGDNPLGTLFGVEKRAFGGNWESFHSGPSTSTIATDLLAETEYSFRVRALNGNSQPSSYDNVVSTLTLASVPLAPGNLSAIALSSTSLQWRWSDKSNNEQGFRVRRSFDNLDLSGELAPGTTYWIQTGLSPNTPHNAVIEAFNVIGSSQSPPLSYPIYTAASQISDISIFQVFQSSVVFYWNPNGNPGGTLHQLQYSGNNVNFYTSNNFQSYYSSGVVNYLSYGTTYYFRLQSVNFDGLASGYSEIISTKTLRGIPTQPGNPFVHVRMATSLGWAWVDNSTSENGFRVIDNLSGINLSGDLPANTTYWVQTGLNPATSYSVQVEAFNESGTRRTTRNYSTPEYTRYAPPTIQIRSTGGQLIDFSWNSIGNPQPTYYDVFSSVDGTSFSPLYTGTVSTQSVISGLLSETTYYFRALARPQSGDVNRVSTLSEIVSAVTLTGPPLPASNPTISSRTSDSLTWGWTDRSNNEEGFRVLRSSDGVDLSGPLAPNTTWWTLSGLAPNTESQVQIQSFNSIGIATSSVSASWFSLAKPPLNISVISSAASNVTLDWSANENPITTNYRLGRSNDGVNFFEIYSGTTTTIQIQGLPDLTTSYFRVKAVNGNGVESGYDNVVTHFVGLQPPVSPSIPLLVNRTTESVTWSWSDNSTRENGYKILNAEDGTPLSGDLPANTNRWIHSGLPPNAPSRILVQAFNDAGVTLSAPATTAYSLARPPSNTSVLSVDGRSVQLSWLGNGNSSTTVYNIEKSLDSVSYTFVSSGSLTQANISDLADNTTNFFRVRAKNNNGVFTAYDLAIPVFVPTATAPPPPGNPQVLGRTGQSLTWGWQDTSSKEDGYRILRDSDMVVLATLTANTTFWKQIELLPLTRNNIQVEAYNSFGTARSNRNYSSDAEFTLANPPTDLEISDLQPNSLILSWSANQNPPNTIYRCYASENDGVYYHISSYVSTTTLKVSDLDQSSYYTFKVLTLEKNYSETASVLVSTRIPVGPPSAPEEDSYSMTRTTDSILWKWKKNKNAAGFRIYRSSDNVDLSGTLPSNTTYWLQTGLTPNSLQTLRLESFNAYGSSSSVVRDSSLPNPPIDTRVTATAATSITIAWSPNGNPSRTDYVPEISQDGVNFNYFLYYSWYDNNTVTKSGLTPETTYYLRVRAQGEHYNSYSPYDQTVVVYLRSGPPPTPNVQRLIKSTSSIRFVWDDAVNEDGYRVLRNSDNFNLSGDLPAGTTSFLLTGLGINQPVSVKIQAFNTFGKNEHLINVRTSPNPPLNTRVAGTNSSSISLTWDPNGNPDDTYYRVEFGTHPLSLNVSGVAWSGNNYQVSGLESGTTYYLRVGGWTGEYRDEEAFDSLITAVVPFGPPVAVQPESVSVSTQAIEWFWNDLPNVLGYRIFDSAGVQQGPDLPGGTTSWMKTGLSPFSEFGIMVECFNAYGSSRTVVQQGRTQANPVENLTVTSARPTSVKLTWSINGNPPSVDYRVEKSTWSFPDWVDYEEVQWSDYGATSIVMNRLTPGTTYYFRVRSFLGLTSTIVSTVTPVGLPAPIAKTITNKGIVWEWEKDIPDATGYRVKRVSDDHDLSGLLPASSLSWLQKDLSPNAPMDVYLEVQGPSGVINSGPTGPIHTLPNPPSELRLTGTGLGKVTLAWNPNENPSGTQYVVGRSMDGSGSMDTYVGFSSSASLSGLNAQTPYTFFVRALGPSGLSEASSPLKLSLPDPFRFDMGSGEWAIETVDGDGSQGGQAVVAVDSNGAPQIFYASGPRKDLKTAKWENGQWYFEVLVPEANIQSPMAVDVGESDLLHLVYNNGEDLQSRTIREKTVLDVSDMPHDSFTNGNYTVSINGQGSQGSSIKIRPNGDKVIVYGLNIPAHMTSDKNGAYLFYEAVLPGAVGSDSISFGDDQKGWNKSLIASTSTFKDSSSGSGEIDLALDGAGQSHVVLFHCRDREDKPNAFGDIVYARRVGDTWISEIVDKQVATEESSVSIEIDSAQRIHIFYHDNKNKRVRHAQKEGDRWTIETIEEGGFLYYFMSAALDGLGRVHLVYLKITDYSMDDNGDETIAGALSYARLAAGAWDLKTIESGEGIGFHPSIAADMAGNVHVAYEDSVKQDLKYASLLGKVMEVKSTVSKEGGRFVFNSARGQMLLNVPANTFDQEVTLTIGPPDFLPMESVSKNGFIPLGVGLEIKSNPHLSPRGSILITIPYGPNDVKGVREASLILAHYDENSGLWIPLTTRVDAANNTLTATIDDLGIVQIMYQTVGISVDETVAYPNPMRPGLPGHELLTFDKLPLGAKLKIYTVRGELVRELNEEGNGQAHWNGRNNYGESVASGVYFVRIEGEGGDKIIKVAVQR